MSGSQRDLIVLVADEKMGAAVRGLLSRPQSLAIRSPYFDILVHPWRDPGCLCESDKFLRSKVKQYEYCVVLFDRHGCGQEKRRREELEEIVTNRLDRSGWGDRAAAVVLDPELEVWVWSDSLEVDRCLGWQGSKPDLRAWLRDKKEIWPEDTPKPKDPKEAVEQALRYVHKPRSASVYEQLAKKGQSQEVHRPRVPAISRIAPEMVPCGACFHTRRLTRKPSHRHEIPAHSGFSSHVQRAR